MVGTWGSMAFAILGTVMGSFLNVVADRVPTGGSLLSPPSRCDHCGRRLAPGEMVPVLSYVALGGRCRTCGGAIARRVLWVELGTGVAFGALWWRYGPSARLWMEATYACLLIAMLIMRNEGRRLPHTLAASACGVALLVAVVAPLLGMAGAPAETALPPVTAAAACGKPLGPHRQAAACLTGALVAEAAFVGLRQVLPGAADPGDAWLAAFVGLACGLPGVLVAALGALLLGGAVAAGRALLGQVQRGTPWLAPYLLAVTFAVRLYQDVLIL